MIGYYLCRMDSAIRQENGKDVTYRWTHVETILRNLGTRGWAIMNTKPPNVDVNGVCLAFLRGTEVDHAAVTAESNTVSLLEFLPLDPQPTTKEEVSAALDALHISSLHAAVRNRIRMELEAITGLTLDTDNMTASECLQILIDEIAVGLNPGDFKKLVKL